MNKIKRKEYAPTLHNRPVRFAAKAARPPQWLGHSVARANFVGEHSHAIAPAQFVGPGNAAQSPYSGRLLTACPFPVVPPQGFPHPGTAIPIAMPLLYPANQVNQFPIAFLPYPGRLPLRPLVIGAATDPKNLRPSPDWCIPPGVHS
jgi:hypothetical protein